MVGGVESYLGSIVPGLVARGHDVALWCEVDAPADRQPIPLPKSLPRWSVAEQGADRATLELRAWRPDVLFVQGLEDPNLEAAMLGIAPVVLFAHAYRGTCISGAKAFSFPAVSPCSRKFGWQCLAHYYPRRCGGLSPITMTALYRRERQRQRLLKRYAAVVAFSEHIRREYVRHGLGLGSVHRLPHHISAKGSAPLRSASEDDQRPWRVLFVGRMETLKGGHMLLSALPRTQAHVGRPLHVTFVGDGRARTDWERQAQRLFSGAAAPQVSFVGWVSPDRRDRLLAEADLVAMPSLWPEPFGLIGVEAAALGVPVAAFAVGGIPEWLKDGVNGHLAQASPARPEGLADAMIKCLGDATTHALLAENARRVANGHSLDAHLTALLDIFRNVTAHRAPHGQEPN